MTSTSSSIRTDERRLKQFYAVSALTALSTIVIALVISRIDEKSHRNYPRWLKYKVSLEEKPFGTICGLVIITMIFFFVSMHLVEWVTGNPDGIRRCRKHKTYSNEDLS